MTQKSNSLRKKWDDNPPDRTDILVGLVPTLSILTPLALVVIFGGWGLLGDVLFYLFMGVMIGMVLCVVLWAGVGTLGKSIRNLMWKRWFNDGGLNER